MNLNLDITGINAEIEKMDDNGSIYSNVGLVDSEVVLDNTLCLEELDILCQLINLVIKMVVRLDIVVFISWLGGSI